MPLTFDHLVYAVPDLDAACTAFAKTTGVKPVPGGAHPGRGTRNALVRLGERTYFELIGPDAQQPAPSAGRWMSVDAVSSPTLTRWAVATTDLPATSNTIAQLYPPSAASPPITAGSRQTTDGDTLIWSMLPPRPRPTIDVIPFAIDWSKSRVHPADSLPDGCALEAILLYTPDPDSLTAVLASLGAQVKVIASPKNRIVARLDTPQGIVEIK